ncbi:MAG TPA: Wzt carbohydrate-binding domain-containing protein, partial [Isosphaeraceae bacterium]|nr:Wzt carbohydrate-binding domain-containing protein [Isosphaeraceae bacterium]
TKTDGYHDLRSVSRTYAVSSPLRLVGVVFNNGGPVSHNAPLRMEIDYETSGAAEGASFGVAFASPAGGRVLCCDTDVPGERYTISGKGSGRVTLVIPVLQLQPGNYILDVGCRSGDNVTLDYLPSFGQVEVLPGPGTPSVIIGRREAGSVRVPPAGIRHVFEPSGRARPVSLTEAKA